MHTRRAPRSLATQPLASEPPLWQCRPAAPHTVQAIWPTQCGHGTPVRAAYHFLSTYPLPAVFRCDSCALIVVIVAVVVFLQAGPHSAQRTLATRQLPGELPASK